MNKEEDDLLLEDEELDDEGSPRKKLSHISSPQPNSDKHSLG